MQRNLFVVMRLCSPVVLIYLDAGFEPQCGRKDFLNACLLLADASACCFLLLLKRVAHPWSLKGGVKPRQGKPSSVIINALDITMEDGLLALRTWHGQDDGLDPRLKNGSFSPQNGPPRVTTAWYMPH